MASSHIVWESLVQVPYLGLKPILKKKKRCWYLKNNWETATRMMTDVEKRPNNGMFKVLELPCWALLTLLLEIACKAPTLVMSGAVAGHLSSLIGRDKAEDLKCSLPVFCLVSEILIYSGCFSFFPPLLQMFHEVNFLSVSWSKRKFHIFVIRDVWASLQLKILFGLSRELYMLRCECVIH